MMTDLL